MRTHLRLFSRHIIQIIKKRPIFLYDIIESNVDWFTVIVIMTHILACFPSYFTNIVDGGAALVSSIDIV